MVMTTPSSNQITQHIYVPKWEELVDEKNLVEASMKLGEYGVHFLPLQIRMANKLELLLRVVHAERATLYPHRQYQHFLGIAHMLKMDKSEVQQLIHEMAKFAISRARNDASDFHIAHELIKQLMQSRYVCLLFISASFPEANLTSIPISPFLLVHSYYSIAISLSYHILHHES